VVFCVSSKAIKLCDYKREIMCYYIYKRKESGAVFLMQWTYERNEAKAIVEQKRESLAGQGWHVFFIER